MNLAFKFPIIYWNTACLIANSGVDESAATDYVKLATAINATRGAGIEITLPFINKANYEFVPDADNNRIIYGLKGIMGVNESLIGPIIENRPYSSVEDFIGKIQPTKTSMIALIKCGAFDEFGDRIEIMRKYIYDNCDAKKTINLRNLPALIKYGLIQEDMPYEFKVYEFNRYLEACCKKDKVYVLDDRAYNFLTSIDHSDLADGLEMSIKDWNSYYNEIKDNFRSYINNNKESLMEKLNEALFNEVWDKYCSGNISTWEMDTLCFYYHEHELANVNTNLYGIEDFSLLPEEPEVEREFVKDGRTIPLYKLSKIIGTCIARDKIKATVSLLTTSGVVTVKFRKEYFNLFDRQIKYFSPTGEKMTDESWFSKGSMIVVLGMRSGNEFISKKYKSYASHQLYKISRYYNDKIELTNERVATMIQGESDDNN